jgi:excinuclease UvrABC ATPase subunit
MAKFIKLHNITTNNLKSISLDIPRNQITVITGLSGSGKTSLAFDTIYAQARKEYLESFSVFNRGELGKIKSPEFESIEGLSPVIAIEQKKLGNNPRSTVGTFSDIYTYLRLLYSRFAKSQSPKLSTSYFSFNNPEGACEKCRGLGYTMQIDVDKLIDFEKSLNEGAIRVSQYKPDSYVMEKLRSTNRFDFDKKLKDYSEKELNLLLYAPPKKFKRTRDDGLSDWTCEGIIRRMKRLRKRRDKKSMKNGEGPSNYRQDYYSDQVCPKCNGLKLKPEVLQKTINSLNISQVSELSILKMLGWVEEIEIPHTEKITNLIKKNLERFVDLGLEYLTLSRPIPTLSGGESQRTKLAKHLGLNLIEMIYILDEPTIGMHPVNINKIIKILKKLRNKGNTVIVVEHDEQVMKEADFLVDIGPKAGIHGGKIVAKADPKALLRANNDESSSKYPDSQTVKVLNGEFMFQNDSRRRTSDSYIKLENVNKNNLKNISIKFAQNVFNVVAGVSGAGKSSLIEAFVQKYPKAIFIDQSAIGKSIRSNPATYSGLFDYVRKEFANAAGCSIMQLSFNSNGKCPKCKGIGTTKIGMHFLDDVEVTCSKCQGKRYNQKALSYKYKDHTIADILDLSIDEALHIFETEQVLEKLHILKQVGLGYIKLSQPSPHLSGGESQRIKLAKYLDKDRNILILDEPTVGLHPVDVDKLLRLLHEIVDRGNTVIVVEHNVDVIRNADWLLELGPKGGDMGGELLYEGGLDGIESSERSVIRSYLGEL